MQFTITAIFNFDIQRNKHTKRRISGHGVKLRVEHPLVMAKPEYCCPARFIHFIGNRMTHGSHRQANPPITDEEIQKESESELFFS